MPRQLAIFFPDGRTEYWLTTLVFVVGDKFARSGQTWVITSISTPDGHHSTAEDGDGRHPTVTVRLDGDGASPIVT